MPPRAVLNAFYAWQVANMDTKQRREYDDALYGFDKDNKRANDALMGNINAPEAEV